MDGGERRNPQGFAENGQEQDASCSNRSVTIDVGSAEHEECPDAAQDMVDGAPPPAYSPPADGANIREAASEPHPEPTVVRPSRISYRRLKELHNRHGQWGCCFCHVTSGAVIIGTFHMMLYLISVGVMAFAVMNPERVFPTANKDVQEINCTREPCAMANEHGGRAVDGASDLSVEIGHMFSNRQHSVEAASVNAFISLCMLMITLLMLFGVLRKQPHHLIPFFFLQVFDFCVASMHMMSYLSYLPHFDVLVKIHENFPFRDYLLSLPSSLLNFVLLFGIISIFVVKGYCINIVWRCYKYLLLCRATALADQLTNSLLAVASTTDGNSPGQGVSTRGSRRNVHGGPEHCMQWLLQQDASGFPAFGWYNRCRSHYRGPLYRKTCTPHSCCPWYPNADEGSKASGPYPEPPPSYDAAMAPFLSLDLPGNDTSPPQYATACGGGVIVANDDSPLLPRYEDAVNATDLLEHSASAHNTSGTDGDHNRAPVANRQE